MSLSRRKLLFTLGIIFSVFGCISLMAMMPALSSQLFNRVSFKDITWSPQGDKIAFAADLHDNTTSDFFYTLYVVDADGENLRAITPFGTSVRTYAWSPDGERLAVVEGIGKEVRVYDTEGKVLQTLKMDGNAAGVGWSSDGSRLAILSNLDKEMRILLVEGENQTELYRAPEAAFSNPQWSPDDTRILFRQANNLWVVEVESGQAQQVVSAYQSGMEKLAWENSTALTFYNTEGVYRVAINGGEIERVGAAPEYQAGVLSPDREMSAKVGCADANDVDESNLDIFPCERHQLEIRQASSGELESSVEIREIKALENFALGLSLPAALTILVVTLVIAPAFTLPYAITRQNWLTRFFVIGILAYYALLILGIVVEVATR